MAAASICPVITSGQPQRGEFVLRNQIYDFGFWAGDEQSGSYSGPEVGFEKITLDLLQARFWITSGLPTTRDLTRYVNTRAFVGTNQEALFPDCS